MDQTFDVDDIHALVEVALSGRLTMDKNVREFEKVFAEYVGAPYAIMVNSGSSANLLAVAAALNPTRKQHLKPGDEVIVPAVAWSTSVWPLIQFGLKPVFVDVDPNTLNLDLNQLKSKITPQTKAIFSIHILGNSSDMSELLDIAKSKSLLLFEDTCESLGSKANGKFLGAMGDFGMYSFYFSHHMTTGEGGMVTCQTQADYDLLKCLRSHGWSRDMSNREELEKKHPDVDPRFLFVNVGFNLRPMDTQAAVGLSQIKKLGRMNENRILNRDKVIQKLKSHPKWNNQLEFTTASKGTEPVWFGFSCLLNKAHQVKHREYLEYLTTQGIENRPIVSGNFVRQPGLKLFGIELNPNDFPGAELVNNSGFFMGLHTNPLSEEDADFVADALLGFDF